MRGYGYEPYFVEGDDPDLVHQSLAETLDIVLAKILKIQTDARALAKTKRQSARVGP